MPKRSSSQKKSNKNKNDVDIIQTLTPDGKNLAAVMLGHLGGLKGGRARAEKLSKERRQEIAKKAAMFRWKKPLNHPPSH